MNRLVEVLILWALAFFYGALAVVGTLVKIYKVGFWKVFKRAKHEKPACLDDPSLGTHGFLHLENESTITTEGNVFFSQINSGIIKVPNVRIHYVASGPEDKPLMLFVHGFPEFWFSWRHQIKEFQKDFRCVAIDQRGYGESDKPSDIEQYTQTLLINDLKQVIIALGYERCTLVAHDWGGGVAWTFGRFFPEMVDKLIIMNAPPSPIFEKVLKSDKKQSKMSWYMFFFQLPYLPEFILGLGDLDSIGRMGEKDGKALVNPLSKEEVAAYKYTFSQKGAWTPPLNYYRAALQLDPVRFDMDYGMPVLVIWGEKDNALSTAIPDAVQKACPNVKVKRVPDAGHFVQMDTPDTVNKLMREWLSSSDK